MEITMIRRASFYYKFLDSVSEPLAIYRGGIIYKNNTKGEYI